MIHFSAYCSYMLIFSYIISFRKVTTQLSTVKSTSTDLFICLSVCLSLFCSEWWADKVFYICQLIKHICIMCHLEHLVKLDKRFHKYVVLCIWICCVHMWVKRVVSMRRYHQTCIRTNTFSKSKNSLKSCKERTDRQRCGSY